MSAEVTAEHVLLNALLGGEVNDGNVAQLARKAKVSGMSTGDLAYYLQEALHYGPHDVAETLGNLSTNTVEKLGLLVFARSHGVHLIEA